MGTEDPESLALSEDPESLALAEDTESLGNGGSGILRIATPPLVKTHNGSEGSSCGFKRESSCSVDALREYL